MIDKNTSAILALTLVFTLAFACGTYYMEKHIHAPTPQATVVLPLGEQNRTESLVYTGYQEVGEPYIVKYDMTFKTLPKSAWCWGTSWSESKLDLDCAWSTPGGATRFATATVSVSLPSTDVYAWNFDRESLSAVPEMRSWFTVSLGYILGTFAFGLLTIMFVFGLVEKIFEEIEKSQKRRKGRRPSCGPETSSSCN